MRGVTAINQTSSLIVDKQNFWQLPVGQYGTTRFNGTVTFNTDFQMIFSRQRMVSIEVLAHDLSFLYTFTLQNVQLRLARLLENKTFRSKTPFSPMLLRMMHELFRSQELAWLLCSGRPAAETRTMYALGKRIRKKRRTQETLRLSKTLRKSTRNHTVPALPRFLICKTDHSEMIPSSRGGAKVTMLTSPSSPTSPSNPQPNAHKAPPLRTQRAPYQAPA